VLNPLNPAMVAEEDLAGKGLLDAKKELHGSTPQDIIEMFNTPLSERSGIQLNTDEAMQTILTQMQAMQAQMKAMQPNWQGETILFTDYAQQWFAKKKLEIAANTLSKYGFLYRSHLETAFAGLTLTQITRNRAQTLINDMSDAGYSVETIKQVKSNVLNPIMELAEEDELIDKNPCAKVTTPKRDYSSKRAATDKEIGELLDVSKNHRLSILVPLLVYTGLRRGEVLALTWDDIDFTKETITVGKSYTQGCDGIARLGDAKSRCSKRVLPIVSELLCKLKLYRATIAKGRQYVLSQAKTDKQIYPGTLNRIFKCWCDKAGIQGLSLHSLRHTFATKLQELGTPDGIIIRLTGHADGRVLEHYYIDRHRDTTVQQKAMQALDGEFSPCKIVRGNFGA